MRLYYTRVAKIKKDEQYQAGEDMEQSYIIGGTALKISLIVS